VKRSIRSGNVQQYRTDMAEFYDSAMYFEIEERVMDTITRFILSR
jgi:hypothetical protein